jgi:hypothetical protein
VAEESPNVPKPRIPLSKVVFRILVKYFQIPAHDYQDFQGRWESGQEIHIRGKDVSGRIVRQAGYHRFILDPDCICVSGGQQLNLRQSRVNRFIANRERV